MTALAHQHHHVADHLRDSADPRAVARIVAEHRDLWAAHVRFDPSEPHHATVWADDRWEVVLGAWLPGQRSGSHDHVGRPGALLVLQGALRETTWHVATDGPAPGRRTAVSRVHAAGGLRTHGAVHVHDVAAEGPDPVVALQVHART
jgi:predicted metal-dependent enzyme (double-stranded beta helix superfamily)